MPKKWIIILFLLTLCLIPLNCCYLIAERLRDNIGNRKRAIYEVKGQRSKMDSKKSFEGHIYKKDKETIIQIKDVLRKRDNAITIHIKGDINNIEKIYAKEEKFKGDSNNQIDLELAYYEGEERKGEFKNLDLSKPLYFCVDDQDFYIGNEYQVNIFNKKRLNNYYKVPLSLKWIIRNKPLYYLLKSLLPIVYVAETALYPIELIYIIYAIHNFNLKAKNY